MAASDIRKASAFSLSALLLAGTAVAFGPPVYASHAIRRFCDDLPLGASVNDLQSRAEAMRYGVQQLKSGAWVVEHSMSLGRATCVVRFDDGGHIVSRSPGE